MNSGNQTAIVKFVAVNRIVGKTVQQATKLCDV